MAPRKPAAKKPAPRAQETTNQPSVETVWLELHGRPWHVEVGSVTWERMLGEGAIEISAPKGADDAGDTQPPATKEKLVSEMSEEELWAVADLHELNIDRQLPVDELLAAVTQALQDKGFDSSVPVSQLPAKGA